MPSRTLVVLVICCMRALAAEDKSPELRLEDLETMALGNHPAAAQAQAGVAIAMGMAKQAGLYPNPTVGYYGDEIRGGAIAGGKQGGFISQTIVTGGKLGAARRVAELKTREMEANAEMEKLRILTVVRSCFYHALAAQRLVDVRIRLAVQAADAAKTMRELGNIGLADRPDVLQAEVEEQRAQTSLAVARQNRDASWKLLTASVGKPEMTPVNLDGDLDAVPDLNYAEWLAKALGESPEVTMAQRASERAEAMLRQERRTPIPDLQVMGILAQNLEPLDNPRRATGLEGGVQLGVTLPLFNRNQGNIAAAKGEIESARQEVARLRLQLTRNMAALFRDYDAGRTMARQYKTEMLPRAEEAFALYQASYQRMAAAYPQVLMSQRTLFQLEAEYVQALDDVWQRAVEIRGYGLMGGGGMAPMR